MLKDLLDRARRVAEEHLPEDVLDAGRRLGRTVAAYAPEPLAEVINYVSGEGEEEAKARAKADDTSETPAAETPAAKPPEEPSAEESSASQAPPAATAKDSPLREDPQVVLDRVRTKAEHGLKAEDSLVVVYATPDQADEVAEILKILEQVEAEIRHNDLRREPQTARQLAKLTGVMVPPYVFINGKHWGARYELEALAASGDLALVVANRLDELSDEARRVGNVRESFSDELSVDNILTRWKLGHILCVDDLDSWYEADKKDGARFYYEGGLRPVDDMTQVAEEIVQGLADEKFEAVWMLDPSVQLP